MSRQALPCDSSDNKAPHDGDLWVPVGLSLVFAGFLSANAVGNYLGFKAVAAWLACCIFGFAFITRTRQVYASPLLKGPAWGFLLFWLMLNTVVDVAHLGQGLVLKEIIGLLTQWVPPAMFLVVLPLAFGRRFILPTLTTVALGCAWFAWLNLAAGLLGVSDARVEAREVLYESWYVEGSFRWQSPLISAGPLSGMLRFAVPILIFILWSNRRSKRWTLHGIYLFALIGSSIALVRVEYRNGFIPIAGLLLWLVLPTENSKRIAILGFTSYALLAPFLWTNDAFLRFTVDSVPEFLLRILGRQDFSQVTVLSGRVDVWKDGLEALLHGTHFLVGTGQAALNSAEYSASADVLLSYYDPSIVSRIDFHQGFLDLLFIYGVLPAASLAGLILVAVIRRLRAKPALGAAHNFDTNLALLCMGLVWLSNAHDGYFSGSNLFCALICYALMQLLRPQITRGRREERTRPSLAGPFPRSARLGTMGTRVAELG